MLTSVSIIFHHGVPFCVRWIESPLLRVVTSTSVARAKSYYTKGFSREDYYTEGQEIIGRWRGEMAIRLGLKGFVDREAFMALCDNLHPVTGEPLTVWTKLTRGVGYDFNFAVTKSVSLLQAITGDQRIVEAFRESMRETMDDIEKEVRTRVRVNGDDSDRVTGNFVGAEFIHFTARPEKGYPDPHLHGHFFVFNATWDQVEQRFKAGQFGFVKQQASFYEAMFQDRVAKKLMALGYPIVLKGKSFEIAGIPEATLR